MKQTCISFSVSGAATQTVLSFNFQVRDERAVQQTYEVVSNSNCEDLGEEALLKLNSFGRDLI